MESSSNSKNNMNALIGNTLRIGVFTACLIALIGGIWYLVTTFEGIFKSVLSFSAAGWVQLGVIVLMLTPVMRVVLSLVDFSIQRDWLYVVITGIVLFIIIMNSLVGVG